MSAPTETQRMSVRFDHENLDSPLRPDLLEILQASLVGADPYRAVRHAVELEDETIRVGEWRVSTDEVRDIYLLGAGKASAPMAEAVEDVLEEHLVEGVVAVKDGYGGSTESVAIGEAAHPVPDERSVKAARAVSHVASEATSRDLVLCLMSGGGSSLLELPAGELTLEDLQETTTTLLTSGLPIDAINTVRKHVSSIKGGQLAELIAPAKHATLAVSDVFGDDLATIASGPTVPDPTTYAEALEVLGVRELRDRVPEPVVSHLEAGAEGEYDETPDGGRPAFDGAYADVVVDRTDALDAAQKAAAGMGYRTEVVTSELDGEASEVGRSIAERAGEVATEREPEELPACLLFAGETTVTVRGRGIGGRNQELALAASLELEEMLDGAQASVAVGAFATDGTDGPTRAAGAIVGPETALRARREGYEPETELENNNSFMVLEATGDLIVTGATRNNISDLICVLVGQR